MVKLGDVLEFRSGHHGIDAPQNLGILLSRQRRKGVPWLRLWTVKGALEVKADQATKRAFKVRHDGDLRDDKAVAAALQHFIKQHSGGGLAEEAEDDLGRLEEALWDAVADEGGTWTAEELAKKHYGEASPQQLRDVQAALERCRRPGVGRFETTEKGDVWRPWTRDEHARMRAAWQELSDLRHGLVRKQDTEQGYVFERVEWHDAEADQATVEWVAGAMAQFIEHDGVPDHDIAGIGGLGGTDAFGMDLHRQLGFLAQDWIRTGHTSRSSDYLHFLLESGTWSPQDAVAALTKRHVNQEPFFEHVADEAAQKAAQELPEPAPEEGRADLRHLMCHTIDPPDAKDFDDAVGIQPGKDGGTRLWVHIADVSHYVRPGTHLDRHAKMRATSVYLPGRVLPMLPAGIADHLCSLRSDGDRFALSAGLDIDADGRVVGAEFMPSLIRVTENLSYGDALARHDAGDEHFQALFGLAKKMRAHRRGLALETGEIRVAVGADAFEAQTKHGNDATQMIEVFMVAANEAVARFLAEEDVPLLYRCHPMPEPEKARRYEGQLKTMGLDVPFALPTKAKADQGSSLLDALQSGGKMQLFGGGMDLPAKEEQTELQGFAALSEEEREAWLRPFRDAVEALQSLGSARAEVATLKMLACLGRAYYTPQNEGHFGLASSHYCHFTSPIRRYPDLVVHRNLKAHLASGPLPHAKEDLERLCDHCSDQERAAAALERRVKDACLVLASMVGDSAFATTQARVTGLTPGSMFILLQNGIEARIGARDLPGGPYAVDEFESMLFVSDVEAPQRFDPEDLASLGDWYDEELGERRKVRVRLGDVVQVRLAGRDVCEGRTGAEVVSWRA